MTTQMRPSKSGTTPARPAPPDPLTRFLNEVLNARTDNVDKKMQKRVQLELPEDTYLRLRRLAHDDKRPIKDIVRQAIEEYLQAREKPDQLDDLVGSIELGDDWSTRRDWRDPLHKHRQGDHDS